jgi:3-oxoacyl-[acyl-carrier-protein] synthase II
MREVVVTGVGAVLPGCDGREQLWDQVVNGRSQLAFEAAPSGDGETWAVGRIRDLDAPRRWLGKLLGRHTDKLYRDQVFYLASVVQAITDARLELRSLTPTSIGLFDGTSRGSFDAWYERIRDEGGRPAAQLYGMRELVFGMPGSAAFLAAVNLGVRGPSYTFSGTCAAGAMAVGHAYREIANGELEVAIASGHDSSLSAPIYQMYRHADLISHEDEDASRAVRPWAGFSGNAFGEGAVSLVLEERGRAEKRGANILAAVAGYRYANNGEHPTSVDTTGRVQSRLLHGLLTSNRIDHERVSFVVGHGNGIPISDLAEVASMQRLFGPRVGEVPLLSVKPIYGHLLGASSALNVAIAALMLREQFVVPTINVDPARVVYGMNHQAGRGAARPCDVGLALSFGVGGHNAAVLLSRPEETEAHAHPRRKRA